MIAALALTLYLECGMPDRILWSDNEQWAEYKVTPVYTKGEWAGYYILAEQWELARIKEATEQLKREGRAIDVKDMCGDKA